MVRRFTLPPRPRFLLRYIEISLPSYRVAITLLIHHGLFGGRSRLGELRAKDLDFDKSILTVSPAVVELVRPVVTERHRSAVHGRSTATLLITAWRASGRSTQRRCSP